MKGYENGRISLLMLQAWHCTGAAVETVGREEISCQYLHGKREVPSPHWTECNVSGPHLRTLRCCILLHAHRRLLVRVYLS